MSVSARRELAGRAAIRYRLAGRKEKGRILDQFCADAGYSRGYAMQLLGSARPVAGKSPKRARKRKYGPDVEAALHLLWEVSGRVCSKRLVPFLPDLMAQMERCGEARWAEATRDKLLQISPATCDRLLHEVRKRNAPKGRSLTRPGTLLRAQIPVRTWADWNEGVPGFFEADLVAHCDGDTSGQFLHSLVLTDVATGWTEPCALLNRSQQGVHTAIESARSRIPFPVLGIDSDNGSEFINDQLLKYCRREKITFTRSRPYKKNDQCRVEQKNWTVVRQNVGYDRLVGEEARKALSALYRELRLHVNFFQPSMKLVSKTRVGPRIKKTYDKAKTPCQRVLEDPAVPEEVKSSLREQFLSLKPLLLRRKIRTLRVELYKHARSES